MINMGITCQDIKDRGKWTLINRMEYNIYRSLYLSIYIQQELKVTEWVQFIGFMHFIFILCCLTHKDASEINIFQQFIKSSRQ